MKKSKLTFCLFFVFWGVAIFQSFFAPFFSREFGFNFIELLSSMLFGAMFGALANFIYGKILAPVMTVGKWRLDFRRWILPFLMCAFVPFFASFVIGALLSRNPAGPVFLMLANMFLTPLTFAFLAARLKEFRIEHVCFSALLLWFIAFPITLANGQPLAFWMGSYLSSAPLAMGGYLIAQGYAAVRAGLVSA